MAKQLIIFDLDGTLYSLRGGSYSKSPLKKLVISNARDFIAQQLGKSKNKSQGILNSIQKKYGEQISIGLEKEYGLDRYKYFNTVWDIPAKLVVKKNFNTRKTLITLKKKYRLVLVSDVPKVWIKNVLKELNIQDLFPGNIFTGEGDRRKGFGNAFGKIIKEYRIKPANCIAVGDQEKTDIMPAKKLGMLTVYVGSSKYSQLSDINIKEINLLPNKLNSFCIKKL